MAAAEELEALAKVMRAESRQLAFLADLDPQDIARVRAGFEAALANQREQINAAIEESLSHVPRVLHRPIRRILFGQKKRP